MVQNPKNTTNVRRHVIDVFRELMTDSDAGMGLSRVAAARLLKSLAAKKQGKTLSLDTIFKKYDYRA